MRSSIASSIIFTLATAWMLPAGAQVIPAGRSIDWSRTGIPGAIPGRTNISTTISAATYGNGTTDASDAINTALRACLADQVVYLPSGTYKLSSAINLGSSSRITLRGAGQGRTILKPADNLGAAITTGQSGLSGARTIQSGSTKGSQSITVNDASGMKAGMILDIQQANDTDFFWSRGGMTYHTGQHVMITAVNGNTIRFDDPLMWSFDRSPQCRYQTSPGITWCGVEDLTIAAGSGYGGSMIQFWNAYACWIRNVETAWGNGNEHIFFFGSLRCEVRECYIHDTYSTTDGYGIVTMVGYDPGVRGGCTGLRIENNVFSGTWGATVLECEVGSVVSYNFCRNMRYPGWPDYMMYDFNGNHSPHGMMCLFEGNVGGGGVQQDGYHGSVSHTTYFRNHFSGKHVEPRRDYKNTKLIDLCRKSYYQNVVGNVLGAPDWPRTTTGRYEMSGNPDYVAQACIYRLGYPNMGNNWYNPANTPTNPADPDQGGLDAKVKSTLLRWGNFDYQNNAARWEANELPDGAPVPADHSLPASLYLSAKPAWWCNDIPWPPIGPDVTGLTNDIPAKRRYEGAQCRAASVRPVSQATIQARGFTGYAVYDIQGRKVRRRELGWEGETMFAKMNPGLPNGIYLMRVAGEARPVMVKKNVMR